MNNFIDKIEDAREKYTIRFLNEKFENKNDNKERKDKLNKLLENTDGEKYKIENIKS